MPICPLCNGRKSALAHINTGPDSSHHHWKRVNCSVCAGAGTVTEAKQAALDRGQHLRKQRLEAGLTLFDYARQHNMTPAQVSALEFGRNTSMD
jgi:hypothetical protein